MLRGRPTETQHAGIRLTRRLTRPYASLAPRTLGVLDAVSSSWDGDARQPQRSGSLGNREERLIHQRAGCTAGRRSLRPQPGVCSSVQSHTQAGHIWVAQSCSRTLPGSEGSVAWPNPSQRPGSGAFPPHLPHGALGRQKPEGWATRTKSWPSRGRHRCAEHGWCRAQQMPVVRAREG